MAQLYNSRKKRALCILCAPQSVLLSAAGMAVNSNILDDNDNKKYRLPRRMQQKAVIKIYTVLIVDDEPILCTYIEKRYPWERLGFRIAGTAANGEEALSYLRLHPADVVLTDIRMPVMDGLELSRKIKESFPKIRTVLFSAYEDFEYARQAIESGVAGYLLKSEDMEHVSAYFRKLKVSLDQEQECHSGISSNTGIPGQSTRETDNTLSAGTCSPAQIVREPEDSPSPDAGFPEQAALPADESGTWVIRMATAYIREHYSEPLTLSSVARELAIHPVYLSRCMSEQYGMTYQAFLTEVRLNAARALLCETNLKVYEICEKVGYRKQAYFSEQFHKTFGMSPQKYRDRYMEKLHETHPKES